MLTIPQRTIDVHRRKTLKMENTVTLLEQAITIALNAHKGQTDKGGTPYILHPLRVMIAMHNTQEMMVAVLHDVVEDTDWTIDGLREEGFYEEVLQAIDCVTRKEEESYDQFIARVKTNPLARKIKIADLEDNLKIGRLSLLTVTDFDRLKKYQEALKQLQGEIISQQHDTSVGDRTIP